MKIPSRKAIAEDLLDAEYESTKQHVDSIIQANKGQLTLVMDS